MRVWLDDLRDPTLPHIQEGYEVACFIEQAAFTGDLAPLTVHAHSDNAVASPRMRAAIENARRYWES